MRDDFGVAESVRASTASTPRKKNWIEELPELGSKELPDNWVSQGINDFFSGISGLAKTAKGAYEGTIDPSSDAAINAVNDFVVNTAGAGVGKAAIAPNANEAGIFGGKLAKGFDWKDVGEYYRARESGVHENDLWEALNLAEFPDKKLRFEIPDNKAELTDFGNPYLAIKNLPIKMEKALGHEELYSKYPDIRNTILEYKDLKDTLGYSEKPWVGSPSGKVVLSNKLNDEEALQTLLHELQHQVQAREGFVGGSSPTFIREQVMDEIKNTLHKNPNEAPKYQQLANDFKNLPEDDKKSLIHNLYRRNLGEAEAGLVTYRMNDLPIERRLIFPFNDLAGIGLTRESLIVPKRDINQ